MIPTLHFLIDASLPRATAQTIVACGHQATDVRDIGLGTAEDTLIAEYVRKQKLCLITRDLDFGNIRDYPPQDYFGIVVIHTANGASRDAVLNLVHGFLQQTQILPLLAGRLAVVEPARIRLKPA